MRILILSFPRNPRLGSREKQTLSLVSALKERGAAFFFIGSCKILINEFKKRNWHALALWLGKEPLTPRSAILFPFFLPIYSIELFVTLLIYKFRHKIDTIYCLTLTEKLVVAPIARLFKMKVFFIEHALIDRWLTPNPLHYLYRLNTRWATVITATDSIKEQLVQIGVPASRIVTVHPGIDPAKFQVQDSIFQNLVHEKSSSYQQKPFVIGAVSYLVQEKGISYLLQAAKIARKHIDNLQIIIIGHGEERSNLIWLAEQLDMADRTVFIGWQKNLGRWMMRFDIFTLPSLRKEGFGLTLLEAMAHGLPIIATKVGSIPEIVEQGKNGILVEPKNPEMLAQAIINLYQHPSWREDMATNSVEKINTYFHVNRMINEYDQLLRN